MCQLRQQLLICYVDAMMGDQFIFVKFYEENHSTHKITFITNSDSWTVGYNDKNVHVSWV